MTGFTQEALFEVDTSNLANYSWFGLLCEWQGEPAEVINPLSSSLPDHLETGSYIVKSASLETAAELIIQYILDGTGNTDARVIGHFIIDKELRNMVKGALFKSGTQDCFDPSNPIIETSWYQRAAKPYLEVL